MPRLKHGSRQPVYIENIRTGETKWLKTVAEADPTNSCASSEVICPECAEKYFKKWRERNGE